MEVDKFKFKYTQIDKNIGRSKYKLVNSFGFLGKQSSDKRICCAKKII